MRKVSNHEWDDIQDRLKEKDAQIYKLHAEKAELLGLVYEAYFCHVAVKVWEDNWREWSAQYPILMEKE